MKNEFDANFHPETTTLILIFLIDSQNSSVLLEITNLEEFSAYLLNSYLTFATKPSNYEKSSTKHLNYHYLVAYDSK